MGIKTVPFCWVVVKISSENASLVLWVSGMLGGPEPGSLLCAEDSHLSPPTAMRLRRHRGSGWHSRMTAVAGACDGKLRTVGLVPQQREREKLYHLLLSSVASCLWSINVSWLLPSASSSGFRASHFQFLMRNNSIFGFFSFLCKALCLFAFWKKNKSVSCRWPWAGH